MCAFFGLAGTLEAGLIENMLVIRLISPSPLEPIRLSSDPRVTSSSRAGYNYKRPTPPYRAACETSIYLHS